MENLENKIIASKLEELNTLPQDYQPNLDSKWALIESSLDAGSEEKKRLFVWMPAAASVLIFSFFGVLFFLGDKTKPIAFDKQQDNITKPHREIRSAIRLQSETQKVEVITNRKPKDRMPIVKKESKITHLAVSLNVVSDNSTYQVPNAAVEVVVAKESTIKKKKSRYVQLDFDDSKTDKKVGEIEKTFYVRSVRVKFFSSNKDVSNISHTTAPEPLLKINF